MRIIRRIAQLYVLPLALGCGAADEPGLEQNALDPRTCAAPVARAASGEPIACRAGFLLEDFGGAVARATETPLGKPARPVLAACEPRNPVLVASGTWSPAERAISQEVTGFEALLDGTAEPGTLGDAWWQALNASGPELVGERGEVCYRFRAHCLSCEDRDDDESQRRCLIENAARLAAATPEAAGLEPADARRALGEVAAVLYETSGARFSDQARAELRAVADFGAGRCEPDPELATFAWPTALLACERLRANHVAPALVALDFSSCMDAIDAAPRSLPRLRPETSLLETPHDPRFAQQVDPRPAYADLARDLFDKQATASEPELAARQDSLLRRLTQTLSALGFPAETP